MAIGRELRARIEKNGDEWTDGRKEGKRKEDELAESDHLRQRMLVA